jgi:hypothetical protein
VDAHPAVVDATGSRGMFDSAGPATASQLTDKSGFDLVVDEE